MPPLGPSATASDGAEVTLDLGSCAPAVHLRTETCRTPCRTPPYRLRPAVPPAVHRRPYTDVDHRPYTPSVHRRGPPTSVHLSYTVVYRRAYTCRTLFTSVHCWYSLLYLPYTVGTPCRTALNLPYTVVHPCRTALYLPYTVVLPWVAGQSVHRCTSVGRWLLPTDDATVHRPWPKQYRQSCRPWYTDVVQRRRCTPLGTD